MTITNNQCISCSRGTNIRQTSLFGFYRFLFLIFLIRKMTCGNIIPLSISVLLKSKYISRRSVAMLNPYCWSWCLCRSIAQNYNRSLKALYLMKICDMNYIFFFLQIKASFNLISSIKKFFDISNSILK